MISYYPFFAQITARLFGSKKAIGSPAAGAQPKKVQPFIIIGDGSPPASKTVDYNPADHPVKCHRKPLDP